MENKNPNTKETWLTIIEPKRKGIHFNVRELWAYRDLIGLFVRRTFVAQYKQTILGPAWAIIQPFLTTVVYTIFFGNIAGLGAAGVPNFVFYLSGTILWTLFTSCLTSAANAFIGNARILGKVYFPRLVMPVSSSISQIIAFGIQFLFLIGFILYYVMTGNLLNPNGLMLMTPLLIIQVCSLGLGFGMIISSLTTKYRDLTMLVSFGVELWKFASPVAYDMFGRGMISPGGKYYIVYMLNPVTPAINLFRYAFLGCGKVDWIFYGISWFTTIVFLFLGFASFNRVERTFMDTV